MVRNPTGFFKRNRRAILGSSFITIIAVNLLFTFNLIPYDLHIPGPYLAPKKWTLILEDEFNGSSINLSTWSYGYPPYGYNCFGHCHNHQGWMADNHTIVENGLLRIKGDNYTHPDSLAYEPHYWGDNYLPLNYTTGAITSEGKFTIKYGYIEARQKMPEGPTGFWPAFWTFMSGGEPGSYSEIDIHEFYSGNDYKYETNLHTRGPDENLTSDHCAHYGLQNLTAGFHVYGVEWHPNIIKFFFDNKEVYRITNQDQLEHMAPQHIRINLAIGGAASTPDENTIWPAWFETDWVRVYQFNEYL
ncbi:MAG: family 16 glycosylhydrolase [Candidatus Hodarchaeota archaeon]